MINVTRVKMQVQKAINTMPTTVNLMRTPKIDDGMGGYTLGEQVKVATFNAFIDESGSYNLVSTQESSVIEKAKKIILISVYDSNFEIVKDDYFEVNNNKYRIAFPTNLFNIAWQCDCEVVT